MKPPASYLGIPVARLVRMHCTVTIEGSRRLRMCHWTAELIERAGGELGVPALFQAVAKANLRPAYWCERRAYVEGDTVTGNYFLRLGRDKEIGHRYRDRSNPVPYTRTEAGAIIRMAKAAVIRACEKRDMVQYYLKQRGM